MNQNLTTLEIAYEHAGRGTAEEAAYFEAKARHTERRMHFGVEIPATTTGVY